MSIVDITKKAALAAFEASNPVNVLYGVVEKADPLEIRIHERLKLTDEFLDVAKHLTRHERVVSIEYINPKTWPKSAIGDVPKTAISNRNNLGAGDDTPFEKFNLKYAKMVFEDGLKIDDKVVLLRQQGGHRFYVADRYREGDKIWSYPKEK